jgi:hypothetical protein
MARLRKPSPLEAPISMPQPSDTRPRRSSPRKAVRDVSYIISSDDDEENVPLRPKASKRDLADPPSIFQEDSFYTSRSHASPSTVALTPRRQRILRPVESNSRLLRKLSDESLASPEKKPGSERRARRERCAVEDDEVDVGRKRSLMYAKSLARSVAGRELKKASSRIDVLGDPELSLTSRNRQRKKQVAVEIQEVEAEPEETSILCEDEDDVAQEVEQQIGTIDIQEPMSEEQEDEEDDDIVVPVRSRQRRPQRLVESDSESEYAEAKSEEQLEQEQQQPEHPQPLVSMRPPHKKGHSTISSWAQEVIDLTDSPPKAPESFVLPETTRARSSSFAVSRPATSSSDGAQPFLT